MDVKAQTERQRTMSTPIRAAELPALGDDALACSEIDGVANCMFTQRAIRHLDTHPVDPALVEYIIASACRAGSGGNRQPWRFVVVVDDQLRQDIGRWYEEGWATYQQRGMSSLPKSATARQRQSVASAEHLAHHLADAPVLVVPCYLSSPRQPVDFFAGASIFPAVQNLLLAARSVGLGATLTTMQALSGIDAAGRPIRGNLLTKLRQLLDIPNDVVPAAVIPIGWPTSSERYLPGRRRSAERVMFVDRWAHAPLATVDTREAT